MVLSTFVRGLRLGGGNSPLYWLSVFVDCQCFNVILIRIMSQCIFHSLLFWISQSLVGVFICLNNEMYWVWVDFNVISRNTFHFENEIPPVK